jgi:hypothetical protein
MTTRLPAHTGRLRLPTLVKDARRFYGVNDLVNAGFGCDRAATARYAQRREPNGRFQRLAAEREAGAQKIASAEKLTVLRVTWISYAKASRRSERLFEVFSNAMDLALRWSRDSRSSLCLVFTLSHPYLFCYPCNGI